MEGEIVISGMSGKFPESDNVAEFSENLYNKVEMITEDTRRYDTKFANFPKMSGKLKQLDKFDNLFFNVHHKQSESFDPQARILLEATYEAIADAGYDPAELRGRKIGVYIGNSESETLRILHEDLNTTDGYLLLGCVQSMFANRISYTFDFNGPSYLIDSACSSAALALYEAYKAISRGDCEAAIVGGAHLCLLPEGNIAFYMLKMITMDGRCKSFDAASDGYVRSEAIGVLFLQKAENARRIYATIENIGTNTDGFKEEGVTFPSSKMQKLLMREVLEECKLDPHSISYIEAHVTGTPVGDRVEMSSIVDVFCKDLKDRHEPLLLGSVKSNIGHTEPSSGICSVIKILLAMEKGLVPPNLHFNTPHPVIKDFVENNEVKIVVEPTPWNGPYALFNCFGFGGVNVSGIFKRNPIINSGEHFKEKSNIIPQLALCCGRTKEGVKFVLDSDTVEKASREFFGLLHKLAYASPLQKPYRGYKLLREEEHISEIKEIPQKKRPVWYVFSGMGSQWSGMAKDLMGIQVFAKSIQKSAAVLKEYNLDLIGMVTNGLEIETSESCKESERRIIPAFVSIAAVQIALVDLLNELELKPDGIVGHSVGELGCAYADGCITAEQMILSSYWRGKSVEDSQENLIKGIMAAVGMTLSKANECCPKDIYPACHNAEDSLTLSGPEKSMKAFMEKLKADNVFVHEVNACGYAFHSDYVIPAAQKLKESMKKVIPNHKPRSSKWISSSYPEDKWNDPEANIADASYFVNNLVSPVLFWEALHHVPKDAILVEIGPHHILQSILKRALGPDAVYLGLMRKNANNIEHFLSTIGNLYAIGLDPAIEKLYPPVHFPVPRSTPMISPLIKWDHSETWTVHKWNRDLMRCSTHFEVDPGPVISRDHFLLGHRIDGRYIYPAAGYINMACEALARVYFFLETDDLSFVFENIRFIRGTFLSETAKTKFIVYISKQTGAFEITEKKMTVCTGYVSFYSKGERICTTKDHKVNKESMVLNSKDFYNELTLRGYEYGATFQGVLASDLKGNEGILKWNGNWIVYLDSMMQYSALKVNKRIALVPVSIEKLTIDQKAHREIFEEVAKEYEGIPVKHNPMTGEYFTGGVYMKNLTGAFIYGKKEKQVPLLEEHKFIPYMEYYSPTETDIEHKENYISKCLSVSEEILSMCRKNIDDITNIINEEKENLLIDDYVKENADNCVFLKCLLSVKDTLSNNDMTENIKKHIDKYIEERPMDFLTQMLITEHCLRPLIDIAFENISSRKLKILEITEGNRPLILNIKEYITVSEMHKISWSLLHPNTELVNKEQLPSNTCVEFWKNKPSLDFENVDLLILNYLNCSVENLKSVLENASKCLKNEGFIVLFQKTRLLSAENILSVVSEVPLHSVKEEALEIILKDVNLNIISKISDPFTSALYLLRKSAPSSFNETVIYITVDKYDEWVNVLKAKMVELKEPQDSTVPPRVWLVSERHPNNGIMGLVNCLRLEPGGSYIRCVYIDKEASELPKFCLNHPFYDKQLRKNLVMNVYQGGSWGSYRHIRCEKDISTTVKTEHAYLNILRVGNLSSFAWIESSLKYFKPTKDAILCHVHYASLNFKDVMSASGKLPLLAVPGMEAFKDCFIGSEFSGRTYDGKRVMGIVSNKGMATALVADPFFLLDVPDEWTLEEAATVPIAYGTAYHALIQKGMLEKGQRILIHAGSGGVGQAAISIALHMGCEVFTSVGSEEKKEFLKKKFPELKDRNFCNSRDTTFEQHILQETNGKGVHVVLNSLAEDKLFASLNCLSQDGCFLEIGKYDMIKNSSLGMAIFLKNISFHGIMLDSTFAGNEGDPKKKSRITKLLKQGIDDGVIKPLNTTVFNYNEAEKAFRYMATGRHTGKILLKIRDEEQQKRIVPTPIQVIAMKRTVFDPKKSYMIIGGLGGFGLELCDWLIDRGAKNVILTSRSGITTGYQQLCMKRWMEDSANVVITNLNASKFDETSDLIKLAMERGPVGGIFNLALVLRDGLMENQTVENFIDVCSSKVETTKNLDLLSRELCPQLDWFVCFSSFSCGRGNPAQSNYGFANSVIERICESRVSERLPGLAIQWGAIGDVGVIHEKIETDIIMHGITSQRISSCLTVLDKFLQQGHPVVSSLVPHTSDEATKGVKGNLLTQLASIFGIRDISTINPETPLGELGLDSLMGVELQQILETNFNIVMTVPELRELKVKDLKRIGEEGNFNINERNIGITSIDIKAFLAKCFVLVDKDIIPKETIVKLNIISDGSPIFVIHPIEGSVFMLQPLAELLPCPVYGIQFTPDFQSDSIESLAAWYWKHIKSMNPPNKYICLAGYSFGASVAFEMALQAEQNLEEYPEIKNLIFLDGSPRAMNVLTQAILPSSSPAASLTVNEQIEILRVFSIIFHEDITLDKGDMENLKSFEERIRYTANKIIEKTMKYESEELQTLYEIFQKELHMGSNYSPKHKLKADICLIKASEKLAPTKTLSNLYDLENVCEGKITAHSVTGNHTDFVKGDTINDVASILKESIGL